VEARDPPFSSALIPSILWHSVVNTYLGGRVPILFSPGRSDTVYGILVQVPFCRKCSCHTIMCIS